MPDRYFLQTLKILRTPTEDQPVDMSDETIKLLEAAGIETWADLVIRTEDKLQKDVTITRALLEIKESTREIGLDLGMDIEKYKIYTSPIKES